MSLVARQSSGGLGFDTSQKLGARWATALRAAGYAWCARYVPLPGVNRADDIDAAELSALTDAGFEVILVQHVRYPGDSGWDPQLHSGSTDAMVACVVARAAGYPDGAHIFLDLEGVVLGIDPAKVIAYCEAWSRFVISDRYRAGLYVGYQQPLSPLQLYDLHGFDQYWSDPGKRLVAVRGCSIEQGAEKTVAGVRLDEDEMYADKLGDLPYVAAKDLEEVA